MRMKDKVVLVTGAGRGIGAGIARRLAREGATVAVADRDATTGAEVASRLATELGVPTSSWEVNVGYEDQVAALVADVVERHGRIDVLVNNAQGFNGIAPLELKTTGELDYSLRTGLFGSFWAMRAAFPHMCEQGGGSIINLTSLDGVIGKPLFSDYDIAKEAIRGLTKVAAREWGPHQIRVNCIAPFAATAAYERSNRNFPGFAEAMEGGTPLRRAGDCEDDIGGVALFLASEDGRYVTGMTMFADGGMFLSPPASPAVYDPSLPRPERALQWLPSTS